MLTEKLRDFRDLIIPVECLQLVISFTVKVFLSHKIGSFGTWLKQIFNFLPKLHLWRTQITVLTLDRVPWYSVVLTIDANINHK